MAVMTELAFRERRSSGYDRYFDGTVQAVKLGEHPGVATVRVLRVSVLSRARTLGVVVRTEVRGDVVLVQAARGERQAAVSAGAGEPRQGPGAEAARAFMERPTEPLCEGCKHPVAGHQVRSGSLSLFCQAAGCACRLVGEASL